MELDRLLRRRLKVEAELLSWADYACWVVLWVCLALVDSVTGECFGRMVPVGPLYVIVHMSLNT